MPPHKVETRDYGDDGRCAGDYHSQLVECEGSCDFGFGPD
jgi:hypothetical protein